MDIASIEELLDGIEEYRFEHPRGAERVAWRALNLLQAVPCRGRGLLIHSRAWAVLGTACRASGSPKRAETSLAISRCWLDEARAQGVSTALPRADLQRRAAYLWAEQGHPERALCLVKAADRTYHRLRRNDLRAECKVDMAVLFNWSGDYEAGALSCRLALQYLNADTQARHFLSAVQILSHALAWQEQPPKGLLAEAARFGEIASRLVPEGRSIVAGKIRWVRAISLARQRRSRAAEDEYRAAREIILDEGSIADAALITLELSALLLRVGRLREVRSIATQLHAVFCSLEAAGEALVALRLFWETARQEMASADLLATRLDTARKTLRMKSPRAWLQRLKPRPAGLPTTTAAR